MKYFYIFLACIVIFSGCAGNSSTYMPPDPSNWSKPRHIFSPLQNNLMGVSKIENRKIKNKPEKHYSTDKVYYFVRENGAVNSLLVFNSKKKGLRLSIPKYKHRPIRAKWINPKLLYIEVFFNPHYGACWIYDVEREKMIYRELQNDGINAWQQAREGDKQTKN